MEVFRQTSPTREDLGLLAVMEAIEEKERITQRELARVTGLNLKKVNYCLHKLLEKGYVKFQRAVHNPDKRSYLYILTPAGLQAKSRLTYTFLKFTLDFYNRMEEKLLRCLGDMVKAEVKRVVLYGASDVARILLRLVDKGNLEVVAVVDEEYAGREFYGVPTVKEALLHNLKWDGVLITALDDFEEAHHRLSTLGVATEAIWSLS